MDRIRKVEGKTVLRSIKVFFYVGHQRALNKSNQLSNLLTPSVITVHTTDTLQRMKKTVVKKREEEK